MIVLQPVARSAASILGVSPTIGRWALIATKAKKRRRERPKGPAPAKRVPDVIEERKGWVIDRWLERVEANAELMGVSLSKTERTTSVHDVLSSHPCFGRNRTTASTIAGYTEYGLVKSRGRY
jgi:hypothetical protein